MFGEFPPPPFGMMPGAPPIMPGKDQRHMPMFAPRPPFMPPMGEEATRKRDHEGYLFYTKIIIHARFSFIKTI
jgi:hypothetical protein